MNKVFLSLGTNIGSRKDNLSNAVKMIKKLKKTVLHSESSIYETNPLYNHNQDYFLNKVIAIYTDFQPKDLLEEIKFIELFMGRDIQSGHNMPRIIDIDILAFGDLSVTYENLIIPHPRILERLFVLKPWIEIEPNYIIKGQVLPIKELHSKSLGNRFKNQTVERISN